MLKKQEFKRQEVEKQKLIKQIFGEFPTVFINFLILADDNEYLLSDDGFKIIY